MPYCTHDWVEKENKYTCTKCGSSHLILKKTNTVGIFLGRRGNNTNYSVRASRKEYFFPDQWIKFIKTINNPKHHLLFNLLINTGGRIDEILNLKPSYIREKGKYIIFYTTKVRSKKKEYKSEPRNVTISSSLLREIRSYAKKYNVGIDDYFFIKNDDKYTRKKKVASIYQLFKRKLNKTDIENPKDFSLHNIRKTHGMWLKSLNINEMEICLRLGHSSDTYRKHYGSADIFNDDNRRQIIKILGDIYGFN